MAQGEEAVEKLAASEMQITDVCQKRQQLLAEQDVISDDLKPHLAKAPAE